MEFMMRKRLSAIEARLHNLEIRATVVNGTEEKIVVNGLDVPIHIHLSDQSLVTHRHRWETPDGILRLEHWHDGGWAPHRHPDASAVSYLLELS